MDEQIIVKADWNPPININCKDILILVVDDDHTSLSVIRGILRSWKYNVETVRNGVEALSILRSKQDKKFDLVVTDIHVSDMNGFELLKRISIDFQVPIVMMSADDSEKTMSKGLECGAAYFMRKPVCPDDLKNLWLYITPKGNEESSPQIDTADTNDNLKINGNINIQPDAGSVHYPHVKGPLPIVPIIQPTITPVEKYYEEVRRKRKLSNWGNQKSKDSAREALRIYPTSVFANRKHKVAWTTGLHNKFLDALKIIGLDRAVPKKILKVMNVPGLTRENVASHLQKYRIFLKRVSEVAERGGDGVNRSKFASSYFPVHFGFDLGHLDVTDENLLRKKLKQELKAIRDPLYIGPSWRHYTPIRPNKSESSNVPFASDYPTFPLESEEATSGFVEKSGINQFKMQQGQAAPESEVYGKSKMVISQHPSAFAPYGMNTNGSVLHTGGLVNNSVPQTAINPGQSYSMELHNSGMMTPHASFGNIITQNMPSEPLELRNINNQMGNGNIYDKINNFDVSAFQANYSEFLIQKLSGQGDLAVNSLELPGSDVRNPFLAFGDYSAQQLNENQETESIPDQTKQDASCFGEDFNPWFDQELPTHTQTGNQSANMLITDELLAVYQSFRGNAEGSSPNGSSKKSGSTQERI